MTWVAFLYPLFPFSLPISSAQGPESNRLQFSGSWKEIEGEGKKERGGKGGREKKIKGIHIGGEKRSIAIFNTDEINLYIENIEGFFQV